MRFGGSVMAFNRFIKDIELCHKKTEDSVLLPESYYQHKKNLCPAEEIIPYIIRPDDVPHYENVLHLRLGDYKKLRVYKDCVLSPNDIKKYATRLNIPTEELVIISDGTENDVKNHLGELPIKEVASGLNDVCSFWAMVDCERLITSPSTFSYWSAYLKSHKDGTAENIVIPDRWPYELSGKDENMFHKLEDLQWWT